jgi:hypothetical protein
MLSKIVMWLFTVKVSLCNCYSDHRVNDFKKGRATYKIAKIGQMPPQIKETSGLARANVNKATFWTHNDGDNPAELFEVTLSGEIVSNLPLPQLKNTDWEDLTQDNEGNLYIADVGNNRNERRDLKIYKLNPAQPQKADTIALRYADQAAFPPVPNARNFDCEAVVWHGDQFHLFSKNRSKINHFVRLYSLPAQAGNYTVAPKDSIKINTMVTGAAISPDERTLALITYGKVLLFDVSKGLNFRNPTYCLKTGRGQTEAIVFLNNQDFLFSNERKGELYLVEKTK